MQLMKGGFITCDLSNYSIVNSWNLLVDIDNSGVQALCNKNELEKINEQ